MAPKKEDDTTDCQPGNTSFSVRQVGRMKNWNKLIKIRESDEDEKLSAAARDRVTVLQKRAYDELWQAGEDERPVGNVAKRIRKLEHPDHFRGLILHAKHKSVALCAAEMCPHPEILGKISASDDGDVKLRWPLLPVIVERMRFLNECREFAPEQAVCRIEKWMAAGLDPSYSETAGHESAITCFRSVPIKSVKKEQGENEYSYWWEKRVLWDLDDVVDHYIAHPRDRRVVSARVKKVENLASRRGFPRR